MSGDSNTFGGRLYSELLHLTGYDLMTSMMNYKTIQQLKVSDRQDTLELFRGSSYEVMQLLETAEPEDVARYFTSKAEEAKKGCSGLEAAIFLMISSF